MTLQEYVEKLLCDIEEIAKESGNPDLFDDYIADMRREFAGIGSAQEGQAAQSEKGNGLSIAQDRNMRESFKDGRMLMLIGFAMMLVSLIWTIVERCG